MSFKALFKTTIIALSVPALIWSSTALAAEKEKGAPMTKPKPMTQQERTGNQLQPVTRIIKISEVIGMTVETPQGDNIGEIQDVVMDPSDGNVAYAVLAAGGFLGLGEKFFAIPWRAFQAQADDDDEKGDIDKLTLNVDKDRMQNAPGFDKDNWPDMANQEWGQTVHTYYDQQDYWKQRQAMRQDGHDTMGKTSTLSDQASISATVEQVRGNKVELQVPQDVVKDLQAGDRVEVNIHK